jgi:hypothetical protein
MPDLLLWRCSDYQLRPRWCSWWLWRAVPTLLHLLQRWSTDRHLHANHHRFYLLYDKHPELLQYLRQRWCHYDELHNQLLHFGHEDIVLDHQRGCKGDRHASWCAWSGCGRYARCRCYDCHMIRPIRAMVFWMSDEIDGCLY